MTPFQAPPWANEQCNNTISGPSRPASCQAVLYPPKDAVWFNFFPFHNIRSEIYSNVANLGYNLKKSIIFYLVTLQEGLAMISGIKPYNN
jgi:hypothetical protein